MGAFARFHNPFVSSLAKHMPVIFASKGVMHMEFNGTSSQVNLGSDVSLDDLPAASHLTWELWARAASNPLEPLGRLLAKRAYGTGFEIQLNNGHIQLAVYYDTTDLNYIGTGTYTDDTWHHFAITFDFSEKTAKIFVDGIEETYIASTPGSGPYVSDASLDLYIGSLQVNRFFQGGIGWVRISNIKRYTSNFTPIDRGNPPNVDVNTIEQWNAQDGSGSILAAQVNTPTSDGIMTDVTWLRS